MSDSDDLGALIASNRQDTQAQLQKTQDTLGRATPAPRGRQWLVALLLGLLAAVLYVQYPRFATPYAAPDAATHAGTAEGDLLEMVGLVETYRITQGQLPDVLAQLVVPDALAARMAEASVAYRSAAQAYTLEWTHGPWRARYDSQSESVAVEPLTKP